MGTLRTVTFESHTPQLLPIPVGSRRPRITLENTRRMNEILVRNLISEARSLSHVGSSDAVIRAYVREALIQEGILSSIGHTALNIAGMIPGVGKVADIANAVWYAKEGEYFNAALSIVSLVPVIGDIIGRGGKVAEFVGKLGGGAAAVGGLALKAAKLILEHRGKIRTIFNAVKGMVGIGKFVGKMTSALSKWVKKTIGGGDDKEKEGSKEKEED